MHYYTISQEREVRVKANNVTDAVRIADAAFTNGQNSDSGAKDGPEGIWGNTVSEIKVIHTAARLDD